MPVRWGEKSYHSLDYALKSQFGEKSLPDCIKRGDDLPQPGWKRLAGAAVSSVVAWDLATLRICLFQYLRTACCRKSGSSGETTGSFYIAYFQAFTNTYAPVEYLEKIFTEAILDPDVRVLAVATRPDCLSHETVELLRRLNQIKPVWIELGLQTIHPQTARYIRRGYPLEVLTML